METDQIDKRVTWLDEQRRKDSEELGRIHDRIGNQRWFDLALLSQLSHHIQYSYYRPSFFPP